MVVGRFARTLRIFSCSWRCRDVLSAVSVTVSVVALTSPCRISLGGRHGAGVYPGVSGGTAIELSASMGAGLSHAELLRHTFINWRDIAVSRSFGPCSTGVMMALCCYVLHHPQQFSERLFFLVFASGP